ncbi:MAG: regulatory protein RecX [Bryobacteraceae bacterium]
MGARKKLDAAGLFEAAVRALAGRAQASGELKRKLAAKAERAADVDAVMSRLKDYGYLDDRRFAEIYAGARLENQGLGRSRVMRDLRGRRIAPQVAERAVAKAYAGVDETALIESFVKRKILRGGKTLETPNAMASAYRKLLRAGFGAGASLGVLKRMAKAPELVEEFEPPEEEPAP